MKLVYIINSLSAGGAEHHVLNLVRDMVIRDYNVFVAVLKKDVNNGDHSLGQAFLEAGANIVYLHSYALSDFGRWYSFYRLIKKLRPDIIHSHLPRSDLAASITKKIFPEIIWVTTIHDAYRKDKYTGYWIFPFLKKYWQRADYSIAVSKNVQKWCADELGIPKSKIRVIYHGVSLYEVPDSMEKNSIESFRIGCLARFEKRKGMETLVKAMEEVIKVFPNTQLLLAGSDPTGYSYVIKTLAKSLGLDGNVKVLGFCATPLEFLSGLDVFAFASTSEGFGIVLIEAMSVRCPVVASDIYPINYIVHDKTTGLLAEPNNHYAFAKALVELLSDIEKRKGMGNAAYERCVNEFSLEKSMNKIHDLYSELNSDKTKN